MLINTRSLWRRDFVHSFREDAGTFRYWYFIRVILRLVSQRRSKIHGGIIHGKKQIGRVWADAISRRFFEAVARVTSRRISVNPGACRWILMQRLDIDRCRRWRSREIFRWRSPSPQIYYHRPPSIPVSLSNEHLPILNRLESIPTTD